MALAFLALWRVAEPPPVMASSQEALDIPEAVLDDFYMTLEEVRQNSRQFYDAFAPANGGAIPYERFVTRTLPEDVVPSTLDRQLLEKLFSALDANEDRTLTRAEWNSRLEEDLSFADANDDGRVTLRELANARENMGFRDAVEALF